MAQARREKSTERNRCTDKRQRQRTAPGPFIHSQNMGRRLPPNQRRGNQACSVAHSLEVSRNSGITRCKLLRTLKGKDGRTKLTFAYQRVAEVDRAQARIPATERPPLRSMRCRA